MLVPVGAGADAASGFARRALLAAALAAVPAGGFAQARAPFLHVREFGAKGDGAASDTAAIQRAIDAAGSEGRTLYIPAGRYRLTDDDGDGACLRIRRTIRLSGDGAFGSYLVPDRRLPAAVDAIRIDPDPAFAADFLQIERIGIFDPVDGRRGGRHGIVADTARGNLPKLTLRDLMIGEGGGLGFLHRHPVGGGEEGGLYGALIENCALRGGIRLENSGDSIRIIGNIISGPGHGVFARLTRGAAMLSVTENNITSTGGGIDAAGDAIDISRNIVELSAPGDGGGAIGIGAQGRRSAGVTILRNTISAFGASRASSLIRATDCDGLTIEGNVMLSGTPGRAAVALGPGCANSRIGANTYNANVVRPSAAERTRSEPPEDAVIRR